MQFAENVDDRIVKWTTTGEETLIRDGLLRDYLKQGCRSLARRNFT